MKRINVIGTTGSGKSTFSKQLAKNLNYPYIEMDRIFWKPRWQESEDSEFLNKLKSEISQNFWVLDGNYSRTTELKWARVDTVIWLDFGFFRNLFQIVKRSTLRAAKKEELWPNTGNIESFARLFSSDSMVLWFFKCYGRNKRRYPRFIEHERYKKIDFIRLRSPKQTHEFLQRVLNDNV